MRFDDLAPVGPRSDLSADHLFLVQIETSVAVIGQRGGMIQRAGMQPEPAGLVAPGLVHRPLEEPFAQTLPDEFGHQTELGQFDLAGDPPVQFGKARRRAVDVQNVNLVPRVIQDRSEFGIRERSEEHTSELQSRQYIVCRLLLEKKHYLVVVAAAFTIVAAVPVAQALTLASSAAFSRPVSDSCGARIANANVAISNPEKAITPAS